MGSRVRGGRCGLRPRCRTRKLKDWKIENGAERVGGVVGLSADEHVKLALLRNFEFKLPLAWLLATPSAGSAEPRRRKAGRLLCCDEQAAPSFQPVAEPPAGGFVAAGRMDRVAGAE